MSHAVTTCCVMLRIVLHESNQIESYTPAKADLLADDYNDNDDDNDDNDDDDGDA